jgi:hypothetical protein
MGQGGAGKGKGSYALSEWQEGWKDYESRLPNVETVTETFEHHTPPSIKPQDPIVEMLLRLFRCK